MTNEQAIRILEFMKSEMLLSFDHDRKEALKLAISALEKQIPKKPIRINKNEEFDGNWKKICPSCGSMLTERITTPERSFPRHYNYTQHCWCGQAIDWTEGEG